MASAKEAGRTSVLLASNTQVKELPTSGEKASLRMDGAQLTREQSLTRPKEAPHPTGLPELLRQRGLRRESKAISSETKAVSATDSGSKR